MFYILITIRLHFSSIFRNQFVIMNIIGIISSVCFFSLIIAVIIKYIIQVKERYKINLTRQNSNLPTERLLHFFFILFLIM